MNALIVASRSEGDSAGWSPVGRLDFDRGVYRFVYTKGARKAKGFRPFDGMEKLNYVYESPILFPIFANRLLSASRPEYDAFLRWSGFDPTNPPEPLAILGVTEGRKQTDMIEVFPCPVPDDRGMYQNKFFLHGLRYMDPTAHQRISRLKPDENLLCVCDVQNESDPNAVLLRTKNDRVNIGYVPRYLAQDVWALLKECGPEYLQFTVHRLNADAPLQQRLLCRVEGCWPHNFKPCDGEAFHPIPENVPVRCEA
jgi:hypothetical protein